MGRETRPTRRHLLLATAALVVVAVAIPIAVSAAVQTFADVPPTDWAYDDIEWVAAAGVSKGCGDGKNFCPDDNVTRREMAVFMHRLSDGLAPANVVVEAAETWRNPVYGNAFILQQAISVDTYGWVTANGNASFSSDSASPWDLLACGLTDNTDLSTAFMGSWAYTTVTSSSPFASCYSQTSYFVGPGTHTVRMIATNIDQPTTHAGDRSLIVSFVPLIAAFDTLSDEHPGYSAPAPDRQE